MVGRATRLLPYCLAFFSSMCIMTLELDSSRLVARHVGASLAVWTSVIGIILGGICLGNVLGGRLADRVEPRRAVGPLFAVGAFLTLFTLWMNAWVGLILPSGLPIPWELRTVLVVSIVFLLPATVLGMVGPVVAKMAVEQAKNAGSAIGDVYFWGAVGSIVGTFFCGFVLMYLAPSSIIVLLVAAGLAALAGALSRDNVGLAVGLSTAVLLLIGSIFSMLGNPRLGAVDLGSYQINYVSVVGNLAGCVLGFLGVKGLLSARTALSSDTAPKAGGKRPAAGEPETDAPRPSLADLAMLAFVASLVFMSFEMVAGRLIQRHLGSGIYSWTSVIGVLLAGLSAGNFIGGKIADFVKNEKQASWLFLASSIITLIVIPLDTQPEFLADWLFGGAGDSILRQAESIKTISAGPITISLSWPFRILFVAGLVFFLPAVTMGTVSPVVAKLAVDRLKRFQRTGTAIGEVYAWGMVGSILGTFLTGFFLINVLGTKGVILVLGTLMAFCATLFGPTWHAVWAGIPLGLCALAFTPPWFVDLTIKRFAPFVTGAHFEKLGTTWGIREETGDPNSTEGKHAWIDESNYYYIKVNNENLQNGSVVRRTLVLDNLIHGYFMLGVRDAQLLRLEELKGTRIPTDGKDLIVVADIDKALHFRIFDGEGKMVVDTEQKKLPEQAAQIEELRKQLDPIAGYDVQLMPPVKEESEIPTTGKKLIVLTSLDNVLQLRYFDGNGNVVVDLDETRLASQTRQIEDLKKLITPLLLPHELTESEKAQVISALPSIAGHTRLWPPHELSPGEKSGVVSAVGSIVGHTMFSLPERLDYDYEHIYALVAYRAAKASGKLTMAAREYTAPPSATGTAPPASPAPGAKKEEGSPPAVGTDPKAATKTAKTKAGPGLQSVQATGETAKKEQEKEKPKQQKEKEIPSKPIADLDEFKSDMFEQLTQDGSTLPDVKESSMKTLFLGGGAYCFQRHIQRAYPKTEVDVAEIDPSVTRANFAATGLPQNTSITTYWGDARQFVDLHQDTKQYDLIFGDAFNDFSVPWHLTTFEFNEKLKKMLTPSGVYMINIIDAYESDAKADEKAESEIRKERITDKAKQKKAHAKAMAAAYRYGGFVGAWVNTAKKTFKYVYIFGTHDEPGIGLRETFVVVVSNQELDLKDLGKRPDDPKFFKDGRLTLPKPYDSEDEKAIDLRSRKIILTDDYAPVENLLAPVAETRGDD